MSDPTESEVKAAFDIVDRMVLASLQELKNNAIDIDDWTGLVEGKRQILRYAIRRFEGDVYGRFEK